MIEEKHVKGEPRQPWYLKLFPLWWLWNSYEPFPPYWFGERHMPKWAPAWLVFIGWYIRNPFHNFGRYVFGIVDRDFTVRGKGPYLLSTHPREDWKNAGSPGADPGPWKFHVLIPDDAKWLRLPFVSYDSDKWRFYLGWQHWGFFGLKFYRKGVI